MIDRIIGKLPEAWRGPAELVAAPIAWVPVLQQTLVSFFFDPQPGWMASLKYVFLLFPVLLGVIAVWSTGLSVYTLPFRSSRTRFISLVLLAWWDAALAVWLYWVGMVRVAGVVVGWALGIARLAVRLVMGFLRDIVGTPVAMSGMLVRGYFKPGVPWLAKDNGAMVARTAAVGWFGVRGLTWFLFGQYGTPPLLALVARRPLTDTDAPQASGMRSEPFWRLAMDDFRRDLDWLHIKSDEMLELLALPVVHLLGAALNFAMILTASRPVFNLPFRSLKEVTESRDMETTMHLEPRKQVGL